MRSRFLLALLLVGACVDRSGAPEIAARDELDPLSRGLLAAYAESREPAGAAIDADRLVALTGRFAASGETPVERALDFVARHPALYGAPDLRVVRSGTSRLGKREVEHVVLRQVIRGVDVHAGELSVLLDGDEVLGVAGALLPGTPYGVELAPALSPEKAEAVARAAGLEGARFGTPRLFIYEPALLGFSGEPAARLVWQLAIGGEVALIDAATGALIRRDDGVRGLSIDIWDDGQSGKPKVFEDGCLPGETCVADVLALADHFEANHDFWLERYGWESYDGQGGGIDVRARADIPAVGRYLSYDEEFLFIAGAAKLDVVAHEFTHGVTEHRASFDHAGEPGALHESFSDLFATVIDEEQLPSAPLGEGSSGGVRQICDPSVNGYAEHYGSLDLEETVYYNGGIPNVAWCQTGLGLIGVGHSNQEALEMMGELGNSLLFALPSDASFYVVAAFANLEAHVAYDPLGDNPYGYACLVRDAWSSVGLTVIGPLEERCGDDDYDGDGVSNRYDNCDGTLNPSQLDLDRDHVGDACDDDDDGEGVPDADDNCRSNIFPNPKQEDTDGDGVGDACEDLDGDGVDDERDNCVEDANAGQADTDRDGVGDACERDSDGDGIDDDDDTCQFVADDGQADGDGDGLGEACDPCDGQVDTVIAWTAGDAELGIDPQPVLADHDGDGEACDRSPWGDLLVEERAAWPLPPGWSGRIEGAASAAAPMLVPLEVCPDGRCAYREDAPIEIAVEGADDLRIAVIDDRGRPVGRRSSADGRVRFTPRGGRSYRLRIVPERGEQADVAVAVAIR